MDWRSASPVGLLLPLLLMRAGFNPANKGFFGGTRLSRIRFRIIGEPDEPAPWFQPRLRQETAGISRRAESRVQLGQWGLAVQPDSYA